MALYEPSTPCPLSSSILYGLEKATLKNPSLYEDLFDELKELRELTHTLAPREEAALILRGFYVLEYLYHRVLPAQSTARAPQVVPTLEQLAKGGGLIEQIRSWRFERSTKGLEELERILQEYSDDAELEDTSLELDTRRDAAVRQHRSRVVKNWRYVTEHLPGIVSEMKSALHRGAVWNHIGTATSGILVEVSWDMDQSLSLVRNLLLINRSNVLYPWQSLSTRSQG